MTTTARTGHIVYSSERGHVCTCTEHVIRDADGMVSHADYRPTVKVDRDTEPTEGGSWLYVCSSCGASAWSGC